MPSEIYRYNGSVCGIEKYDKSNYKNESCSCNSCNKSYSYLGYQKSSGYDNKCDCKCKKDDNCNGYDGYNKNKCCVNNCVTQSKCCITVCCPKKCDPCCPSKKDKRQCNDVSCDIIVEKKVLDVCLTRIGTGQNQEDLVIITFEIFITNRTCKKLCNLLLEDSFIGRKLSTNLAESEVHPDYTFVKSFCDTVIPHTFDQFVSTNGELVDPCRSWIGPCSHCRLIFRIALRKRYLDNRNVNFAHCVDTVALANIPIEMPLSLLWICNTLTLSGKLVETDICGCPISEECFIPITIEGKLCNDALLNSALFFTRGKGAPGSGPTLLG